MAELATYHWFWKEAINRLESLRNHVLEGRDLDEAANFCRFLLNSGIDKILKPHDNAGFLKVDSAFLMWKAQDVLTTVQDLWARGSVSAKEQTHLEAIHHKLDLIAGALAMGRVAAPTLSVIRGVAPDATDGESGRAERQRRTSA